MKLVYIFSRFDALKKIHFKKNIGSISSFVCFIDWLFALIIHGASLNDYFAYNFYKLRYNGRKEFVTYRRYQKIQNLCNKNEFRDICRDKIKFNIHFNKYIGRNWLDTKQSSIEDFKRFLENNEEVFIKDIASFRGVGIKKINSKEIDVYNLYKSLINNKENHYILEEKIEQIEQMAEFHPWSVNTIRIVTVYDYKKNNIHLMNARLRVGNKKNNVDNFHFGGIAANIDISTGIVNSVGYDTHNNTYIKHPITEKKIVGFQIPYWEECKKFIMNVSREIPEIKYIGWDVVIQEGGSFILIEGNDNADHDFQQLYHKGLWKEYKQIIKSL